jgi:hypothetical protein
MPLQVKDATGATVTVPTLDDDSFLYRISLKLLSKLTFTTGGLRVDASGATITANIAASQTLATVTTVGTVNALNNGALGRVSVDGMGIQMTYCNFQTGFRRNLIQS